MPPSGIQYVPIPDSELRPPPGTRIGGGIDLTQVAEVVVCVRPPSSGNSLEEFVREQSHLPARNRQHLSRSDLAEHYGADPEHGVSNGNLYVRQRGSFQHQQCDDMDGYCGIVRGWRDDQF